jgi:hypothetical protein
MKKTGMKQILKTVEEIKPHLRSGDHILIAEIVGCSSDYVRMVMYGIRKSERILYIASKVIENRDQLIAHLTIPKK